MLLDRLGCLVQFRTDVVLEILELVPSRTFGNKERLVVLVLVRCEWLCLLLRLARGEVVLNDLLLLFLERVRETLQEHHAEDVVFELRRVHVATEDVCCFPKKGLKLLKGEFLRHLYPNSDADDAYPRVWRRIRKPP